MTGMSAHTLRYYERIGLLQVERDVSGHRFYTASDVKWARCVRRLKESGMPLQDILIFASLRHHCCGPECARLKVLEKHKARLEALHAEILEHIDMIDGEIETFKSWNRMKY